MNIVILVIACLLPLSANPVAAQATESNLMSSAMTLEQKVAQMFMVSLFGSQLTESEADFMREVQPGALVLFGRNVVSPAQVTALTNSYQELVTGAGGPPLLIAVDQEGGMIQHLQQGFTRFPAPMLWTATQNESLIYDLGAAMASELRAVGVNMNLAPVADLQTYPFNPIIDRRSFGNLPGMVAPILTSFIRGMQDNGVMATVKHFPGHGDTLSDSHLELPVITHDRHRLDAIELQPFVAALEADVGAVMVAHIWFTAFDEDRIPASLSHNIVGGLLRRELSYDGIIMTDALDMDAIDLEYKESEAAIRAIEAGNDLIAIGAHVSTDRIRQVIDDVVDAVRSGRIPRTRIDASVRRILSAKAKIGILDWQALDPETVEDRLYLSEHHDLVSQLFEQGATEIDPQDMIPVGARALFVYPGIRPRIRRECDRKVAGHEFLSYSGSPTDKELSWAKRAASESDTVVVFTLNNVDEPRQMQLVKAMPAEKTVLVTLWNPTEMLLYPPLAGYVLGYSPMLRATELICQILLGEKEAKGSLPLRYAS